MKLHRREAPWALPEPPTEIEDEVAMRKGDSDKGTGRRDAVPDPGPHGADGERQRRAERLVADAVGRLIEFWGFRGGMGRCWALLYLSEAPLTAAEIRERLSISAGAASMALSELERWGVVRRLRPAGQRKDYFEAETDIWKMVSRVFRERELVQIEEALAALSEAKALLDVEAHLGGIASRRAARFARDRVAALVDLTHLGRSLITVLVEKGKVDFSPLRAWRRRRPTP